MLILLKTLYVDQNRGRGYHFCYLLCKTHLFPGEDVFQVRGQNGLLLNSMTPVPVLAGEEQIQSTADQALETFYPIAPTIDLQRTHVYQEKNDTGQPPASFVLTHSEFLKQSNWNSLITAVNQSVFLCLNHA